VGKGSGFLVLPSLPFSSGNCGWPEANRSNEEKRLREKAATGFERDRG